MNAKAWFFCFRPEIPILAKFGPKIIIFTLNWNLKPMLIRVCRSQGDIHFSVFEQKYPFWVNLVQKKQQINSWNLLDYCNLSMKSSVVMFTFLFSFRNTLYAKYEEFIGAVQFFSFWLDISFSSKFDQKSQNYHFRQKFGTKNNFNMQNYPTDTRRPGDVPWRSSKGPNVWDLQWTSSGPSGDS